MESSKVERNPSMRSRLSRPNENLFLKPLFSNGSHESDCLQLEFIHHVSPILM